MIGASHRRRPTDAVRHVTNAQLCISCQPNCEWSPLVGDTGSRRRCGRRGPTPRSIVGIVSVADDGGSSGTAARPISGCRRPGDLRRCLSALASDDSLLARSLEHRFDARHARGSPAREPAARRTGRGVRRLPGGDHRGRSAGRRRWRRSIPPPTGPVTLHGRLRRWLRSPVRSRSSGRAESGIFVSIPADPPAPTAGDSRRFSMPTRSSSVPARCSPSCWLRPLCPTSAQRCGTARPSGCSSPTSPTIGPRRGVSICAEHLETLAAHGDSRSMWSWPTPRDGRTAGGAPTRSCDSVVGGVGSAERHGRSRRLGPSSGSAWPSARLDVRRVGCRSRNLS